MSDFVEIANKDYRINYTQKSGATPSQHPTKIETTSTKNLINDKEVLVSALTLLQNGNCTLSGYTHVNGTATIQPSAEKCLAEQQKPLRKDDEEDCNGTFTHNQNGSTYNCKCTVKIIDAGDTSTLGK